jgi:O-antigen ligase
MLTYTVFSEKSLNLCRCLTIVAAIAAPISTAVTSIASVAILVSWLISGQALQSLKTSFQHPVGKMIVLFGAWLIVGALYADTDWPSKLQTLSSWKKLFFVFILLGLFYQQQWQRRFVYYYVMIMVIAGIAALPLWALDLVVKEGKEPGIIMTNYSTQSLAFIAALLCCLFLVNQPLNAKYKRYLWAACALFLLNIFFVSPARSGYLALPPAAVFACITLYGYKKLPRILGILFSILLVAALSSSNLQQRIKLGLEEQNNYQSSDNLTSIGVRMVFYKNTMELIKENPLFGYGTSSFETTYSAHAATKSQDWHGTSTGDPHNQYLFIWLENGLIGLLLFFAYIYTAIRQGLSNKPYGPIASSFLVAICASSLFNSHFKTFPEGYLLAFFLGALLARPLSNPSDSEVDA